MHHLDSNVGFPAGVNAGLDIARGDVIALLNDDAFASPGWIDSAVRELRDPSIGAVTPKLVFARPYAELRFPDESRFVGGDPRPLGRALRSVTLDGTDLLAHLIGPGIHRIEHGTLEDDARPWRWTTGEAAIYAPIPDAQAATRLLVDGERAPVVDVVTIINSAGTYVSSHGFGGDYGYGSPDDGAFDVPADRFGACGAAIVTTRSVIERVGGLAGDFFAYYEDLDWSWRLQLAGLRVRYQPDGVVRHVGGATTGGPIDRRVLSLAARNRILCLARNAPLRVLAPEVRRSLREGDRDLRRALAVRTPRALAQRRHLRRTWQRTADDVWAEWAGVNERWPASAPT